MPLTSQKKVPVTFEYLLLIGLTLGFAVAVFFIASGLSGISARVGERDSMAYWTEANIGISRYYSTPRGTFLTLRNNEHFVIRFTSVSLDNVTLQINASPLSTGESISVIHSMQCSPGGYSYKTTVGYVDVEHNTPLQFTGVIPLIGTCQT